MLSEDLPMIQGIENLHELFNIFHDGGIAHYRMIDQDLELKVEIQYLAALVQPHFQSFSVLLCNARDIGFRAWTIEHSADTAMLTRHSEIFEPELEILGAEITGDALSISCGRPIDSCDHSGGHLFLTADAAQVVDEAGKSYSIKELGDLCGAYWRNFGSKKS